MLGTPTIDEFYNITSKRSREYIRPMPLRRSKGFSTLYPNVNPLAADFLEKTLTCADSQESRTNGAVDPRKRFTVTQCLEHPYLEAYHDPEDEPSAKPLDPLSFEFDLMKEDMDRQQLKQLLYDEVRSFKRPL